LILFLCFIHFASSAGADSNSGEVVELPRSLRDYDSYYNENVVPFVQVCGKLGEEADSMGKLTLEAFDELRKFLLLASACKEPPQEKFPELLTGIATKMKALSAKVQRNAWEKHAKTISEGLGCLNWVVVKPAPCDFIESFVGGSDYWANTIRREFRTTNPDQIAFCDLFRKVIVELIAFVKEHHRTGVSWNKNGIDVSQYHPSSASAPSTTPSQPATPTPEPSKSATVDLFSALNKGGEITSKLKTVTKDQQTWRAEYKSAAAPPPAPVAVPAAKSTPAAAGPAKKAKGPPKCEFQAGPSKWLVENYSDASQPVTVTIGDKKETVYILNCSNVSINIIGKCKNITLDTCLKTKIYFDTVMATFQVINSQRVHVECRDQVSSVAIDKTDGIVVQLPLTSLDTSIVASKSSEMNVTWPGGPDGDLIERPIPGQYVHRISGTSITAEVSDLYGH